ncbi:DeoR family transcriptional regulator [Arthrobacter sp. NPDC058097]
MIGSTIRRDLALLNGQGRLARTHGGATALGAHQEASFGSHW